MNVLTRQDLKDLKLFCNEVRKDVVSMIYKAQSGHPGGSLSCVEILSTLYCKCMKYCPKWKEDKNFEARDRFILAKGHASATLYSILAHLNFFPLSELGTFRQLGSRLQGHPSSIYLPGIEVSTGSLGQGLSIGCGIALGLKLKKNFTSSVFVLMGDGEMQEGSVWEAIMNASHNKLDNLVAIIDKNRLQIDGSLDEIKSLGSLSEKFRAFNWQVYEIDGHDELKIYETVNLARQSRKPVAIIANTIKGKGVSFMEDEKDWHGKAPDENQYRLALEELGN